MKKIVVLTMAIFLIFSINGFSQNRSHNTVLSAITEQSPKRNAKSGRKPRKSVSKKKVHKSVPKRHSQSSQGSGINL